MKKIIFKLIIYALVIIFTVIFTVIIGSIFSPTIINSLPLWHSIKDIPEGKITKILSIRMVPMGHFDNLFVENNKNDIYYWERRPNLITFGTEKWEKIHIPNNLKTKKLRAFNNYPNYGIFIQTTNGQIFKYIDNQNWEEVSENNLPQEQNFNCANWPKVMKPFGKIVEKKDICMVGAMSEEVRNYVLLNSGEIMLLSRTISILTVIYTFIFYSILGFIIGILLNIFLIKKLINRKK